MTLPYSVDALLLCALLRGPNYGLGLSATLSALDPSLRLSQGALYQALARLRTAALVPARDVPAPADRGGPPRRVYTLTAKGRRNATQLARLFAALGASVHEAA
jgi:DNA-binding PadR family transcriptional regulator